MIRHLKIPPSPTFGRSSVVGDPALLGYACPDIERSEMPWAGDDVALDLTVREGTTLMRARVAKREVLAARAVSTQVESIGDSQGVRFLIHTDHR